MLGLIVLVSAITHPVLTGAAIAGYALYACSTSDRCIDVHLHKETKK